MLTTFVTLADTVEMSYLCAGWGWSDYQGTIGGLMPDELHE